MDDDSEDRKLDQMLDTYLGLLYLNKRLGVITPEGKRNIERISEILHLETCGPESSDADKLIDEKCRRLLSELSGQTSDADEAAGDSLPPVIDIGRFRKNSPIPQQEDIQSEIADWVQFIRKKNISKVLDAAPENCFALFADVLVNDLSSLYDVYRRDDRHFFFHEENLKSPELLDSARQRFIDGQERQAISLLMDFCRMNPGTILERYLPFPKDKILEQNPDDRKHSGNATDKLLAIPVRHDDTYFTPVFQQQKATELFQDGHIREAIFAWTLSHLISLKKVTPSLHALIAFYGAFLKDFQPLQELMYRVEASNDLFKRDFSTLLDLIALEYAADKDISGTRSYTSLHNVYGLQSKEGFKKAHLIAKISREGLADRIDAESENLHQLAEQVGTLDVFGSQVSIPSSQVLSRKYPGYSLLLQEFITDSKTIREILERQDTSDPERLRHAEVMVGYTALFQMKRFRQQFSRVLDEKDYLNILLSKLRKLRIDTDDGVNQRFLLFMEDLSRSISKMPVAFYINSSIANFLFVSGEDERYYKIDFESDERRCHLIDPVTLISDPFLKLEPYREYLMALYDSLYSGSRMRLSTRDHWMCAFFERKDEGELTSPEEAGEFNDRYGHFCTEFKSTLVAAEQVGVYRDISIIIDRLLENRRLTQMPFLLPGFRSETQGIHESNRGARIVEKSIEQNGYELLARRKSLTAYLQHSTTDIIPILKKSGLL